MTRLTLEWHLRGIIEGTVEPECVREDVEYDEVLERYWPIGSYYADPHVEGNTEQRGQHEAGSYTTGFTQESGDFCDVYEVPAHEALRSDDPVQFLDAVAHDPTRRFQERNDAAQLLKYHIWPDAPRDTNTFSDVERDDVDSSEWVRDGMTRRSIPSGCHPMRCTNPRCHEGECLADPDTLRDEGRPVCMVCGTEQPIPAYPD